MNCKPFRLKIIIVIVPSQIDVQCTRTFTVSCPFFFFVAFGVVYRFCSFSLNGNVSVSLSNDGCFKTVFIKITRSFFFITSSPCLVPSRLVSPVWHYSDILLFLLFYYICWLVTMPQMIAPANCLTIAGWYCSWTALTQCSLRTFSTVLHWWWFTLNWMLNAKWDSFTLSLVQADGWINGLINFNWNNRIKERKKKKKFSHLWMYWPCAYA